ncbi:FAD-dependent oxidoreductase [Nocardia neocaledoniensis]|uniref:flavin monoamine oxidase family protein n=1 Tax=Nocardia neocaledoniensis TaxID=236511 RepID=UPI0033CBB00E
MTHSELPDINAAVAIIGAGLSGSAAAHHLLRHGITDIMVLEAGNQPGGRVRSTVLAGEPVDLGAQFVGPSQTSLLRLLADLGLSTIPMHKAGRNIAHDDNTYNHAELDRFITAVTDVGAVMNLVEPWTHPEAKYLDGITVIEWARTLGIRDTVVLGYISTTVEMFISGSGESVSALWFAYFVAAAGGWHELAGGTLDARVAGGVQQVALRVADTLAERIRFQSPVTQLDHNKESVTLTTADGYTVEAGRVIVACSPSEVARIQFEPPLPSARTRLDAEWTMSAGMKFAIAFESPFWRKLGLSGSILPSRTSPVGAIIDNTPSDGTGPGVLIGFANSRRLASGQSHRSDRMRIVESYVHQMFGVTAPPAIDYVEHIWAQETWISGCMSPNRPGVLLDSWPIIRSAIGRIHFAGTETSDHFNGYMEGAVRAGQRAADEILSSRHELNSVTDAPAT